MLAVPLPIIDIMGLLCSRQKRFSEADTEENVQVDLDLGNYERFLDVKLTRDNNITTGKIYQSIIDKERRGDYLGKTVQVVPRITDAIQEWIERVAMIPVDGMEGPADVCVIELGGTIGDIESMPFIEALGQFSYCVGPGNFCLAHVGLVPVLNVVGEQMEPERNNVKVSLRQKLNRRQLNWKFLFQGLIFV